jgi:hypothetical protein
MNIEPGETAGGGGKLIPNPKLKLQDQFHEGTPFKHLSERTEPAYWQWVIRFLKFHRHGAEWRPPRVWPASTAYEGSGVRKSTGENGGGPPQSRTLRAAGRWCGVRFASGRSGVDRQKACPTFPPGRRAPWMGGRVFQPSVRDSGREHPSGVDAAISVRSAMGQGSFAVGRSWLVEQRKAPEGWRSPERCTHFRRLMHKWLGQNWLRSSC